MYISGGGDVWKETGETKEIAGMLLDFKKEDLATFGHSQPILYKIEQWIFPLIKGMYDKRGYNKYYALAYSPHNLILLLKIPGSVNYPPLKF